MQRLRESKKEKVVGFILPAKFAVACARTESMNPTTFAWSKTPKRRFPNAYFTNFKETGTSPEIRTKYIPEAK